MFFVRFTVFYVACGKCTSSDREVELIAVGDARRAEHVF